MVPTGQITEEELKSSLEVASNLIQNGQGSQIMPSEQLPLCFDLPLTAYRFHSLTSKGSVTQIPFKTTPDAVDQR